MGEVVNLRQARKAKARAEREKTAAGNRAAHGRSKADKSLADAVKRLGDARIDGHRRTDEP